MTSTTSTTSTSSSFSPSMSSPVQPLQLLDLHSLGKPKLLEEAIIMRNLILQRNNSDPIMSAILDKVTDISMDVGKLNLIVSDLQNSNKVLENKVDFFR